MIGLVIESNFSNTNQCSKLPKNNQRDWWCTIAEHHNQTLLEKFWYRIKDERQSKTIECQSSIEIYRIFVVWYGIWLCLIGGWCHYLPIKHDRKSVIIKWLNTAGCSNSNCKINNIKTVRSPKWWKISVHPFPYSHISHQIRQN